MIEIGSPTEFPQYSFNNMKECRKEKFSGCYSCTEIINNVDIIETCDEGETAICPRCSIDALLPGFTDVDWLIAGSIQWFTGVNYEQRV